MGFFRHDRPPTEGEVKGAASQMDDQRLAASYARSKPGTAWREVLSDEIGRRDVQGTQGDDDI